MKYKCLKLIISFILITIISACSNEQKRKQYQISSYCNTIDSLKVEDYCINLFRNRYSKDRLEYKNLIDSIQAEHNMVYILSLINEQQNKREKFYDSLFKSSIEDLKLLRSYDSLASNNSLNKHSSNIKSKIDSLNIIYENKCNLLLYCKEEINESIRLSSILKNEKSEEVINLLKKKMEILEDLIRIFKARSDFQYKTIENIKIKIDSLKT